MAKEISRREMIANMGAGALVAATISGEPALAAQVSAAARDTSLFDIHQHVETTDANYSDFRSADEVIKKDYDARIKIMDDNGISRSVMMISTQYRRTDIVRNSQITSQDKTNILSGNATRLFGLNMIPYGTG